MSPLRTFLIILCFKKAKFRNLLEITSIKIKNEAPICFLDCAILGVDSKAINRKKFTDFRIGLQWVKSQHATR